MRRAAAADCADDCLGRDLPAAVTPSVNPLTTSWPRAGVLVAAALRKDVVEAVNGPATQGATVIDPRNRVLRSMWLSYAPKLLLIVVAIVGLTALYALDNTRRRFERERSLPYELSPAVIFEMQHPGQVPP